jgi:hypothetical protein
MPNSVDVLEIRLPIDKVRALTEEQRYTYYLLGFIYNELMCLRKLIAFTLQQVQSDKRPVRANPEWSQTLMLFRIACAKAWEAHLKLTSREIAAVLRTDIFLDWTEGRQTLKELNKVFTAAGWLAQLRNNLGFHYPTMAEWKPYTTPAENWVDDLIYAGPETGNVFYDASESVAKHHMFGHVDGSTLDQVKLMVDQMIDLLGRMTSFVEESLGRFVIAHFIEALPDKPIHKISARGYLDQRIPFWLEMSKAKARKKRRSA